MIYSDTWISMGEEDIREQKLREFEGFQVTADTLRLAPTAIFMHCLPAYRGVEVSADVIDGPRSVVFQQGHNRMHAARGALAFLLGDNA